MKYITLTLMSLSLLFTLSNCASVPMPPTMAPNAPADLSKTEAEYRARQVAETRYNLYFDLTSPENFQGRVTTTFELLKTYNGLRVDFFDGIVKNVSLNSVPVPYTYNNHFIWIDKKHLKTGTTTLVVEFIHKYSKNGSGLHQFIDPDDKKRYLFTDLEPFDANNVFPVFDQPNIKATYKMTVKAPKNWSVITSVRESEVKKEKDHDLWSFPQSARFSTYIWSLHAGEYHVWEDKANDIPLRLFARQSLAKYVKSNDWFQFTREGFEFFNEYFAINYPYIKYDQIIVPEFNAGAMENVGAVTFSERFVSRGEKSEQERMSLSMVILHEMAHMWFGNLVTMTWWDDLWLNESFATYMAHLALSSTGEFKDKAWVGFNRTKRWAYWEDQLVTTHPIEANVPNTQQAMANFDGITYGKGASSLKQLAYYIGEDNFKQGTRAYFKKHAGGNTELKDFIAAMDATTNKNLVEWQKLWLQTSGVNTINADFVCDKNKITKLTLTQSSAPEHPHTRPHALQVALLNQKQQEFFVEHILKVYISTASANVSEAVGLPCPKIVFPNYGDHAYVNIKLDPISLGHLKHGISNVKDPFLRNLFWSSLWDMVVYAKLSFEAFGDILLTGSLRNEKDPFILREMIQRLSGSYKPSVIGYYLIKEGGASRSYKKFVDRTESLIWRRLKLAKPGSEQQKIFFDGFVKVAESPLVLKRLRRILDGGIRFRGLKIDQDKRWSIIYTLSSRGYPSVKSLIRREAQRDTSHQGQLSRVSSEAALPNWNKKQEWIKKFTDKSSAESFAVLRSAIYSLFPTHQSEFRKKFSGEFYNHMKTLGAGKETHKARTFTALTPDECQNPENRKLEEFIKSHPDMKPTVVKQLKIHNQQYERCRKAIELARSKKFSM